MGIPRDLEAVEVDETNTKAGDLRIEIAKETGNILSTFHEDLILTAAEILHLQQKFELTTFITT